MNKKINLKKITNLELQFNEELLFFYVIKGEFLVFLRGKKHRLKQGDLLIINYLELGFILPLDEDNLVYSFHLDDCILKKHIFTKNHYIRENIYRKEDLINDEVLNIINIFYYKNDMENINLYINQFFIRMDKYIKIDDSRTMKINYSLELVKFFEGKKKINDLSLEDISREINLSQNHLAIYFKDLVGINISSYRQLIALKEASRLLIQSDNSISNISYELGYKHSKSVYDIFDKYIGMTPKEYRDRYRTYHLIDERNLVKSIYYMDFVNRYENVTFKELYDIKLQELTHIEIEESLNAENYFQGVTVYSLGNFGLDYMNQIKITNKEIKIKKMIINLEIYGDRDYYHLKDLNIDISRKDLIDLIDLLFKLDIEIGLQVDLESNYYKKISLDNFKLDYETSLLNFYNDIKRSLGLESLLKIENILNLTYVENPLDMEEEKFQYYLKSRLKIYELVYDGIKTDYSLSYGPRNKEDIKEILKRFKDTIDPRGPNKIYYVAIYKDDSDLNNGLTTDRVYEDFNLKLDDFYQELNYLNSSSISSHPSSLVLDMGSRTKHNIRYFDNFVVLYIGLNMIIKMKSFSNLNYMFKDKNHKSYLYYSKYFDRNGFKTENFHLYSFINRMHGNIIYSDKNCIATKTDYEYNVLVFGNILYDYKFCKINNFNISHEDYRILSLKIKDLKGEYRVTKEGLNIFNGSSKYKMQNFSSNKNLDREDYDYIDSVNRPSRESKVRSIEDGYREQIKLYPFSVVYINYKKI